MVFGTVPLLYGLFHDFLFAKSIIIHRMIRMNPNGLSDVGVDSREKDIPNFVQKTPPFHQKTCQGCSWCCQIWKNMAGPRSRPCFPLESLAIFHWRGRDWCGKCFTWMIGGWPSGSLTRHFDAVHCITCSISPYVYTTRH